MLRASSQGLVASYIIFLIATLETPHTLEASTRWRHVSRVRLITWADGWRCYRVTATLGNLLQGRHGDSWLVTPCHALVTWLSHGSAKVPKFNVNFTDLLLPLRHRTTLLRISPRPLKRGDTPRPHCGSHTSPLVTPQLITAAETLCNVPSPVIYLDTRGDSDTLPCNCCLQTLARSAMHASFL